MEDRKSRNTSFRGTFMMAVCTMAAFSGLADCWPDEVAHRLLSASSANAAPTDPSADRHYAMAMVLSNHEAGSRTRGNPGTSASPVPVRKKQSEIVQATDSQRARQSRQPASRKHGATQELNDRLLNAAAKGRASEVRALLKAGADVEARDTKQGGSSLTWAAVQGHLKVVRVLLPAGADVNARSKGDWTPLMFACARGHVEIVQLLLQNGADVDAKTLKGRTVFRVASEHAKKDVMKVLVLSSKRKSWGETTVKRGEKSRGCLSVRSGPSDSYPEVKCLKPNEKVRLNGFWTSDGWAYVFAPAEGWVKGSKIDRAVLPREKRLVFAAKTRDPNKPRRGVSRGGEQSHSSAIRRVEPDDSPPPVLEHPPALPGVPNR